MMDLRLAADWYLISTFSAWIWAKQSFVLPPLNECQDDRMGCIVSAREEVEPVEENVPASGSPLEHRERILVSGFNVLSAG
jgi:hypothetical protein